MSDLLISELQRLYIIKGQQYHEQDKTGESYFPAGPLTPVILGKHLAGTETIALNLVSEDGLARALVIDFDGVAHGKGAEHWAKLCTVSHELQQLGLPAPAVSVSGRKGWGLWLSLADPVPVAQAQNFLHLVRKAYLSDLPKDQIDLRPDTDRPTKAAQAVAKLPPCLHRASGKWAAFIQADMGVSFIESPGLDAPPPLDKQAAILAGLQSITLLQFMQALTALQNKVGVAQKPQEGPKHQPDYGKEKSGYLPPCIASLVDKGAPHEMQYNTANLNLKAFCSSAKLTEEAALDLAEKMAEASEDHPTTKATTAAKLKNFKSNAERPFHCEFARNTLPWAQQYGGSPKCLSCKIAPPALIASDNRPSRDQNTAPKESPVLEGAVALDLLAQAWAKGEPLPQIRQVWPLVRVGDHSAPWYRLAAEALDAGATSAAFFGKVESFLSEIRISVSAPWKESAAAFFKELQAHKVTEAQGKAAQDRGLHLERRHVLTRAVQGVLDQGPEVAANVVAMKLRGAAEDALRAEQGNGPLQGLRKELFTALARPVSEVVPTPFPRLSGLLHGGWRGGRLYVLIAPPKAGKTTLAAACLDHAAGIGYPCLYVGYEMAREQMVEYSLSRRLCINSKRIETRDLTEGEAEKVAYDLDQYLAHEGQYLEVWEAGLTTSIADMAAWVMKAKATHPGKTPLVVVDYLQLAYTGVPEIDRHPSETKRVSEVAVACKHLARQTGAAVIALSSVTKSAEVASRQEGEIDVTAARDSLAIIHAADGVLALQTSTVTITEGKGDNKEETELDPWAFIATQMRVQGRDSDAVLLERSLQKMEKDGYPQGGHGHGIRARLSLLRHRGSTGDVALYYRRAFHMLEEVLLPGMGEIEQGYNKPEISISVFQKYVNQKAPDMLQQPFPEFEVAHTLDLQADTQATLPSVAYRYITDLEEAKAEIAKLQGLVGLDLETTGLSPITAQARLLQLTDGKGEVLVIDLWKAGGLAAFKESLAPLHLVAHNALFDLGFLYKAGIEVKAECTMLAYHVLTGKREGLKTLARTYLELDLSKEEQVSDWSADPLTESQLRYAALDAQAVQALYPKLQEELEERESMRAYTITRDAQPSVVRMELAGMPFNAEKQAELITTLTLERNTLLAALGESLEGRNPASGQQVAEWLTLQLGGEDSDKYKAWPKTAKGQLKTGAEDLKKGLVYLPDAAASVIRDCLLRYKEVEKKLSAFGQGLADKISPITHRIHAEFHLAGTETGRMSCSKPNLQQIPREGDFRALFTAPEGRVFVIADYSQMELRVGAEFAQEQSLIEAYKKGEDTHAKTAAMLLNKKPEEVTKAERQLAKAVNFGLLFGQGAKGLQAYAAGSYGVEITEAQAKKYRDAWFKAYPAFATWQRKSSRAAEKALSVRTAAGRERRWESLAEYKFTEALNTPIQGSAAEAILSALAYLEDNLRGLDAVPIAVIHDEVIVETTQAQAEAVKTLLERSMIQGFQAMFPEAPIGGVVEASIGQTWADK